MVGGACVVYYQPTISRPSADIPQIYPDTRPPGNGHVTGTLTPAAPPVSYCYSDPSTARPRDSGCRLGARECGCSGRRACGVRRPRELQNAYRWKCGRTGVREAGREVIVVATGITCGMMRWSADTYKCALRVKVGDGGYTPPVLLHVLLLRRTWVWRNVCPIAIPHSEPEHGT